MPLQTGINIKDLKNKGYYYQRQMDNFTNQPLSQRNCCGTNKQKAESKKKFKAFVKRFKRDNKRNNDTSVYVDKVNRCIVNYIGLRYKFHNNNKDK